MNKDPFANSIYSTMSLDNLRKMQAHLLNRIKDEEDVVKQSKDSYDFLGYVILMREKGIK